jgi:hypothetical protein
MPTMSYQRVRRPDGRADVRGRGAAALAAVAVTLTLVGVSAPQAAAATGVGWVRLAHLSPDTPPVDVYLTSYKQPDDSVVLRSVAYGTISPYRRTPDGMYSVSMRPAGAAASTKAVYAASLDVASGKSYTVAGVGRNADLAIRVLEDDLTAPAPGTARARVVHASSVAPVVDVVTTDGTTIATGAQFATMTKYAPVRARTWALRVVPKEGSAEPAEVSVEAQAGSVYSLFVLDKDEGVTLVARNDSAGAGRAPRGGVDAGIGGPVSPGEGGGAAGSSFAATGLILLAVLGVGLVRSRRRRVVEA